MSVLDSMVNSPFAEVVGWMVLHSLWEGAIISALLAAALLPMRSPRLRYAAGYGAMLLLMLALGITLRQLVLFDGDSPVAWKAAASSAWNVRAVVTTTDA